MTQDTDTEVKHSDEESEHMERLKDPDHDTPFLGTLEGLAVDALDEGTSMLFLHGSERSCAVEVEDLEFADGLSRAGVEIEAVLEADSDD